MARRKKPNFHPSVPTMRPHHSGQARVELNGRTHYLGPWGSVQAAERYADLIRRWEAGGRQPLVKPHLVGQGGAGKSMALLQLAASVATGARWLDHFHVPTTSGKVMLVLGEEDIVEAHRRLFPICRAMEPEDRAEVRRRIVVLSLRGAPRVHDGPSTLLEADPGRRDHWQPTAFSRALQTKLATEPAGWSLIVVEPLSRLAGVDTDLSNHAATAIIGELERLTAAPGNPNVLVGIHSNKATRNTRAATVRGASALTDGVRLEFALSVDEHGRRRLATTKTNYGWEVRELRLVRDAFGVLRVDHAEPEPEQTTPETSFDNEITAVVEALKAGPVANQKQLAKRMGKRPGNVAPALNEAVTRGLVRLAGTKKERRYELATQGGESPPYTPREPGTGFPGRYRWGTGPDSIGSGNRTGTAPTNDAGPAPSGSESLVAAVPLGNCRRIEQLLLCERQNSKPRLLRRLVADYDSGLGCKIASPVSLVPTLGLNAR